MKADLALIRERTISAEEYVRSINPRFIEKWQERKQTYMLQEETSRRIKELADGYLIVAFSAEWCKDCITNIPVLDLLSEKTGIDVRIFGKIKSDPLSHTRKWRIPPSPQETETFRIEKLPTTIIFDKNGFEVGRIIEKPATATTLEQEILWILLRNEATKPMP